jgi:hypothetical protein
MDVRSKVLVFAVDECEVSVCGPLLDGLGFGIQGLQLMSSESLRICEETSPLLRLVSSIMCCREQI